MAVVFTNVLSSGGATSGGTNITASWTPDGTSQFVLTVSAYVSTGSVVPVISGVTGNGLTWTPITHVAGDNTGADRTVQYLFVAPAGGSVGGATISWSTAPTKASWVLDKVAGADSLFGSGTLPQAVVTATSSGANPSATLGSALRTGSVTYASACFESSAGTLGAGTGYTALGQDTSQSLAWTISEWNSAGSTTAAATNSTTTNRHSIILIEVPTPATGPTITAFQTSDWTSTGTPKTITVTGAVTGDKIVALYGGDNGGSVVTDATVTTTGGSTSAWTEPEEGLAAGNQAWISSSVADVTASGTVTVNLSRTQGTADPWGGWAALVHNHNGIGVHARSAPSATETVTLTGVTQDSAVLLLGIDWDDLANVLFSPGGATDVQRSFGTNVAWYAGYWRGQASGTRGYGIATSSTTNLHIIAIEALAASSSLTGTASSASTATLVAAGTVATGTAAALTETAGISASGSAGVSAGSTPTITAGLTAAGATGRSTGSTLAATAGVSAVGAATSSPALPVTATITAAGVVSGANAASLAVTSAIAAAGAASGAVVLPVSAVVTAAGNVATSSGASLPVTAAVTASSGGGASSGSALAVTGAVTAAGNLTASGTAAVSTAASVAAAGVVGKSTGAALAVTAGTSAAGVAAYQGQASLTVTSTVTAAPAGAGLSSGSTTAVTATIAASGTTAGGSTATTTATITATGNVGSPAYSGSASSTVTVTAAASGIVGRSATATEPVTVTLTATGSASLQRTATLLTTAVLMAAGSVAAAVTTRPYTGTTTRPGTGRTGRPYTGITTRP